MQCDADGGDQKKVPDRSAGALTTVAAVSESFPSKMNRKHCVFIAVGFGADTALEWVA